MKKKFIYIVIALFFAQVQANAGITTEEQFSEQYIINHGYSEEMFRLMNLQHNQILGVKPTMSDDAKIYRPWENAVRRFFMYIDPGLDDERFMQHDIKYTIRWDEL